MTTQSPAIRPRAARTAQTWLLRLEALLLSAAAIAAFRFLDGGWGLYFGVWLAPDLAMLGYALGPRAGATCYNVTHSLILPLGLTALGLGVSDALTLQLGLIWISHVGIDRFLGYGLKYPAGFHHTHFTRT